MAATPATSLTRISSGLQDARLQAPKGNPSVDQFVKVLQKTTRWASQWRRVEFDGSTEFGKKTTITLPRIAELINGVTLVVEMPDIYTAQALAQAAAQTQAGSQFLGPYFSWTNALGHALIDQVELEIGGVVVDRMDGRLLEVLDEFQEPVETLLAKNKLICRAAKGFGSNTWTGGPGAPITVYVPLPFWFSKPGKLSHALPIDALAQDRVRIHVTFRPATSLYYTDARWDARTVGIPAGGTDGGMLGILGSPFWISDPAADTMVYSMSKTQPLSGTKGRILEGYTMPTRLPMSQAYMLVDYVSVEEPEAIGLRSAELTYFVEQHVGIPVLPTQRALEVRVPLPIGNMAKELMWAFQRPEAEAYNAWFLFTRELSAFQPVRLGPQNPCLVPWWPDAEIFPTWDIQPAFRNADSEPLDAVRLFYNSYERFELEGGSIFRSLIPCLSAKKAPVHDRYVYMWSFEHQGGEGEGPKGVANWEKIPRKELYCTMKRGGSVSPPNMNVYVWCTGWNVFKVYGGRGSMLFMD